MKHQSFRVLNPPPSLSHTISVRGDEVDDVLVIPLDLFGVVSCFPTFKPSQEEFETCPRYELTYEIPVYDPTVTFFSEQEATMTDSYSFRGLTSQEAPSLLPSSEGAGN
jgi:hypothetical protein